MAHTPFRFQTLKPLMPLGELVETLQGLIKSKLWLQVLIALVLGIAVGIALGPDAGWVSTDTATVLTDWLALAGHIFLRLVKMIIIPLVFSSIIIGLVSSGDPAFLKQIGLRLVGYFVATTTLAIAIGFAVAGIIRPGQYVDASLIEQPGTPPPSSGAQEGAPFANLPQKIVNILPDNPLEAMVSGEMLSVVIFTLIVGVAVLALDNRYAEPLIRLFEAVQQICMTIVRWAMKLAPLAVFGLMTQITSRIGLSALSGLGMYVITVLLGLGLLLLLYYLIAWLLGRIKPGHLLRSLKEVQLLAFSTSSSAAVMPLSIKTAEERLAIRPAIARFLVPVGATINMDGTALYQAVAVLFLAQVFEVELSLPSMIMVVLVTVGSSIGAPSTPGVGVVILASILDTVGIPTAGIALILGVDRILDMSRTAVNVTGDLTACSVFQARMPHLGEEETPTAQDELEE